MKTPDASVVDSLNSVERGNLNTNDSLPNMALAKSIALRQAYNVEGIKVDPFLVFKMREAEKVALLANASVVQPLALIDGQVSQVKGWKEKAANEDIVASVAAGTAVQKAALNPENITLPEAAEGNLKVQLQKVDEMLQRFQKRNGLPVDVTKEIGQVGKVEDKLLQGNGADDVMRRFYERNPDVAVAHNEVVKQNTPIDAPVEGKVVFPAFSDKIQYGISKVVKDEPKQIPDTVNEKAPNAGGVVFPAFSDQIQYVPRVVKDEPKQAVVDQPGKPASVEGVTMKPPTVEKVAVPKDTFDAALERGNRRMENTTENLGKRKTESMGRLKSLGLSIERGAEAFSKIGPKKKLAIGIALAGATAMTGGTLAFASGALSAASFASKFYVSSLKKAEAESSDVNKMKVAGKAIMLGILATIGTSIGIGLAVDGIGAAGEYVAENYGDQIGSVKDAVKGYFDNLFSSTASDLGAISAAGPDVGPMGSINTGTDFGFDPNTAVGSNVSGNVIEIGSNYIPPSHTFIPGDNLTTVISNEIIAKLPEAAGANPENIIQNLLNLAETGDQQFEALQKFLRPGAADQFGYVQAGDTIDLDAVKKMITTPLPEYDGQTLIEHARKIAGK